MKRYFLLFISVLLIQACSSTNKLGDNEKAELLEYNITLSQGGGFTGERQGYIIDSSGTVNSFSAMPNSAVKTSIKGKMSIEQIAEVNKLFPSILGTKYNENSNMTTSILLKKGNTEFRYSWGGVEPDKNVPSELSAFYARVINIINNLKD